MESNTTIENIKTTKKNPIEAEKDLGLKDVRAAVMLHPLLEKILNTHQS